MPSSSPLRSAFSLVEVMIAVVILSGCIMALVGFHGNLQQARTTATTVNRVMAVGRSIVDQVVGQDSSRLGDSTLLPWSVARYDETDIGTILGNNPALTDTATIPANNLLGAKLLQGPSGVPNLRIYIEYYKGAKNGSRDASGGGTSGVLDDPAFKTITIPDDFRTKFRSPLVRSQYRLDPTTPPARQLSADDVFLVRIVIRYGSNGMVDLLTAKRVEAE